MWITLGIWELFKGYMDYFGDLGDYLMVMWITLDIWELFNSYMDYFEGLGGII